MKNLLLLLTLSLTLPATLPAQDTPTQDTPFNGLITDSEGRGVKARISVKHSDKHTIADKGGKFGLTNLAPTDTLILQFRSDRVEIPLAGRRSLKIVWQGEQSACQEDEELVDLGIGYVKRREYTSSASGISGETMRQRGFSDIQSALLTMVPGLELIGGELVIRGVKSVNLGSGVLVICDGSPVSSVNSVSIFDVKSVEVLKGSNMYGVRGTNGVIVIRTRDK